MSTHPNRLATRPQRMRAVAAAGVAAGALAASTAMTAPIARADSAPATASACAAAGDVWVVVHTYDGRTLANECVGKPGTGTQALTNAHLALSRDSYNMFCRIGGYPASASVCAPHHVFNGQYWQYYHLVNGKWSFSNSSADAYKPAAGAVEGWCYNAPQADPKKEVHCDDQLPIPAGAVGAAANASASSSASSSTSASASSTMSASDSASATATDTASSSATDAASSAPASASTAPASTAPADTSKGSSKGPWGIVTTLVVLAAAAAGYLLWRRRSAR